MNLDKRELDMLRRLHSVTQGCRPDMHEPDEQEVRARVVGTDFDNANGIHFSEFLIERGAQEIVLIIEQEGRVERFNMASLVAILRQIPVEALR